MLRRVLRLARMLFALMICSNRPRKKVPQPQLFGQCPNRAGIFWNGPSLTAAVQECWHLDKCSANDHSKSWKVTNFRKKGRQREAGKSPKDKKPEVETKRIPWTFRQIWSKYEFFHIYITFLVYVIMHYNRNIHFQMSDNRLSLLQS